LLGIFSGCVEHRYLYRFNLDGSAELTYTARGDSADIHDPAYSLPEAPFYAINTWTELDTAGNPVYNYEAKARFSPDSLPSNPGLREAAGVSPSILLQHPTTMRPIHLYFLSIFRYEQTFESRRRTTLEGDRWDYIPAECKVLESGKDSLLSAEEREALEQKYAAGLLAWNAGRYKLRFREILDTTLARHPDKMPSRERLEGAIQQLEAMLDSYYAALPVVELDLVKLEWWDALEPEVHRILLENLNQIGDTSLQVAALQVSDMLELRRQVDEDLVDESFTVQVDLPGRVLRSNTNTMEKGVLQWRILGQDFEDQDVVLAASSLYLYPARIFGAFVLIAALIIGLKARRRTEETANLPPPPPTGPGHRG